MDNMKPFLFLIFISLSSNVFSQKTIQGTVSDSLGNPIEFVNIGVLGTSIGTVSNVDGDFVLKIPYKHLNDTLAFSFIGHKTIKFSLSNIEKKLSIVLEEYAVELGAVMVNDITAEEMMRKVVENIPQNYDLEPHTYTLYTSEQNFYDNEKSFVLEAVVDMYQKKRE